MAESVNTPSLEPRGRLLISKLPFPRRDFQQYDVPESARRRRSDTLSPLPDNRPYCPRRSPKASHCAVVLSSLPAILGL